MDSHDVIIDLWYRRSTLVRAYQIANSTQLLKD